MLMGSQQFRVTLFVEHLYKCVCVCVCVCCPSISVVSPILVFKPRLFLLNSLCLLLYYSHKAAEEGCGSDQRRAQHFFCLFG